MKVADGIRGYSICTSPRSGSNFLCQHLSSTGVLGHPLEYFNWRGRRFFNDPTFPECIVGQVEKILTMGATPNRIYGLKIFAHQHDWISREIDWINALPNLHFVYLSRRDLLGQAVSWARAIQTGQYRSSQPANQPAVFDAELIRRQLDVLVRERARWEMFYARTGIEPLRLEYELVVANPQDAVRKVADMMGLQLQPNQDFSKVVIQKQRDSINLEWAHRFKLEQGNPNVLDIV
ncbi:MULTISPECIES: Stf0 family sulfotransferase [unclassified Mesorhizobium]|uniref:Stf0 family sulfotransferase n=1 Tax=unclassified Mesorhizobium TaxID=325217 RepID=UPI0015E36FEC|nr:MULTISPECIES: Stf0 family sulfotransferase [unclassified Mesorhizobium]